MSEIKEFWEVAHKENKELWLTGSHLTSVWTPMKLMAKLASGIKVLNVGVGLGKDTNELVNKGAIVDVLDISQTALDRVKATTRNQYISSNLDELPESEYDIAVSHLVSQHMNDDDLLDQIKYVLRSLKPEGIFAMQFAFIDETPVSVNHLNEVYKSVDDIPKDKKGHMFRSLLKMEDMVKKCGGEIIWVSDPRRYPNNPIKWYYIHMKK